MDISASHTPDIGSAVQVEALKKSIDVKERDTLKVLENTVQQTQQATAQKTGLGGNINITG